MDCKVNDVIFHTTKRTGRHTAYVELGKMETRWGAPDFQRLTLSLRKRKRITWPRRLLQWNRESALAAAPVKAGVPMGPRLQIESQKGIWCLSPSAKNTYLRCLPFGQLERVVVQMDLQVLPKALPFSFP
jgi:hypothetical protein